MKEGSKRDQAKMERVEELKCSVDVACSDELYAPKPKAVCDLAVALAELYKHNKASDMIAMLESIQGSLEEDNYAEIDEEEEEAEEHDNG